MRAVAGKNTLYHNTYIHLRFLCIYINQKNSMSEICADSETGFSAHRVQLSVLRKACLNRID